jgi:hypothetical protein
VIFSVVSVVFFINIFLFKNGTSCKKTKLAEEMRLFREKWSLEYFLVEFRKKPPCLICTETIAVMKDYNLMRRYDPRQASVLMGWKQSREGGGGRQAW